MSEEIIAPKVEAPVAEAVETKAPEFTKVEQTALEQGWVPKDAFQGEEHKWVDAGEFLRRGELFGKIDAQNRELKETRKTLAALEQHYLKVQETEYKRALADLKKQKKEALIENDVEAVLDVDEKIEELREEQIAEARASAQAQVASQQSQPHPEFVAWTNKNGWYQTNRTMTAFADAFGADLRDQGKAPSEVLRLVTEEVKKKFPDKFYNPKREEPSAVEGAGAQKGSGVKGIALTELETTIMKKLVGQGVLTKEQYLKDIAAQRERS